MNDILYSMKQFFTVRIGELFNFAIRKERCYIKGASKDYLPNAIQSEWGTR